MVDALDTPSRRWLPGLSDEAAWPTLRAHLLLLGAGRREPRRSAAGRRRRPGAGERHATGPRCWTGAWTPPGSAARNAAVLLRCRGCPEFPPVWPRTRTGVPTSPSARTWSSSSPSRSTPAPPSRPARVGCRCGRRTASAPSRHGRPMSRSGAPPCRSPPTTGDRPAHRSCRRPPRTWQRRLNRAVTGDHTPALKEWRQLLYSLAPQVRDDEFTPAPGRAAGRDVARRRHGPRVAAHRCRA